MWSCDAILALWLAGSKLNDSTREFVATTGCSRHVRGCRAGRRVQLRWARSALPESGTETSGNIPVVSCKRRCPSADRTPCLCIYCGNCDNRLCALLHINCRRPPLSAIADQQLHFGLMNVRSWAVVPPPSYKRECWLTRLISLLPLKHGTTTPTVCHLSWRARKLSVSWVCQEQCARPRTDSQADTIHTNHGGLAVFYQQLLKASRCTLPSVSSFECLAVKLAESRKLS